MTTLTPTTAWKMLLMVKAQLEDLERVARGRAAKIRDQSDPRRGEASRIMSATVTGPLGTNLLLSS